ncbi:MAG TPA: 50S ribosomal protein L17 [Candidatus Paceibacterota bacterium]
MRHGNANRKFGRVRKQRKALLNSLARSLVLHEKIKTTEPKAKELRPFVEKLVTSGKKATVAAHRSLATVIGSAATKILVSKISKKYEDRRGGFTRIVKLGNRKSDGSPMAVIEFV